MDQRYFNGIGNYLRAEILYRAKINPFDKANDVFKDENSFDLILDLCKEVADEAYQIGGGELLTWKNPEGKSSKLNFKDWLQCYGKMESIVDGTGRKFWYNVKYKGDAIKQIQTSK